MKPTKTLLIALACSLTLVALAPYGSAHIAPPGFPWPGGQTPDVQCMDVYSETHIVGPYWLVRRDSCSAQVYECPPGYDPPAPPCHEASLLTASAAAAGPPAIESPPIYCMPYERRIEAGPVTVIQGGCGNDVRLCDDGRGDDSLLTVRSVEDVKRLDTSCIGAVLPPLHCTEIYARYDAGPVAVVVTSGCSAHVEVCGMPVHQRVDVSCIAATQSSAAASEPNCLYYYMEVPIGPVTHVIRDSCHSEQYMCEDDDGVWEDSETVEAYLAGQLADPDPEGLVDCTVDSFGLVSTSNVPGPQRTCWRQGQGELQSEYCVQPDDPDCLVFYRQITGMGSSWVCYPSGESGSDW